MVSGFSITFDILVSLKLNKLKFFDVPDLKPGLSA